MGWSFSWFFCILSAYYVVRPIRETMGTIVGEKHFDLIFLAIFISMLLASLLFSALMARVGRNRLVPIVFRFFTVWLIGFSLVIGQTGQP